MARLEEAGLNKNLAHGQISGGYAGAPPELGYSDSNDKGIDFNQYFQAEKLQADTDLTKKMQDKVAAEITGINSDNRIKEYQADLLSTQLDDMHITQQDRHNISRQKSNQSSIKTETDLTNQRRAAVALGIDRDQAKIKELERFNKSIGVGPNSPVLMQIAAQMYRDNTKGPYTAEKFNNWMKEQRENVWKQATQILNKTMNSIFMPNY